MPNYTWDLKDWLLTLAGNPIIGGAAEDDPKMNFEWNGEAFVTTRGADGDATRNRVNNDGASLTLRLAQSSEVNELMWTIYQADVVTGSGIVSLQMRHRTATRNIISAAQAWIRQPANFPAGKNVATAEWPIELANPSVFLPGLTPMGAGVNFAPVVAA